MDNLTRLRELAGVRLSQVVRELEAHVRSLRAQELITSEEWGNHLQWLERVEASIERLAVSAREAGQGNGGKIA